MDEWMENQMDESLLYGWMVGWTNGQLFFCLSNRMYLMHPMQVVLFVCVDAAKEYTWCIMMPGTHNSYVIQYTVVRCMFNVYSARQCSLLYACIPFCVCIWLYLICIYLCMYCTAFQDGMRWDAINVTTFCNQHKQVRTENTFCPCI